MLKRTLLPLLALVGGLTTAATSADACVRFVRGANYNYWVNTCGTHVNVRYCVTTRRFNGCRQARYTNVPLRPNQRKKTVTAWFNGGRGVNVRWFTCRGRNSMPTGHPPTRCTQVATRRPRPTPRHAGRATGNGTCVAFVRGSRLNYWVNRCGTNVNVRYCAIGRFNYCAEGRYSGFPMRPGQRIGTGTARGAGERVRWYVCRGRFNVPTGRPPTRCRNIRGANRRGGICPPTWTVARNRAGTTVCSCRGNYYGPTYTWKYYRQGSRCR